MKKFKNILMTIIFSVMLCITGVFLTSCGQSEINIAISASEETIDIFVGDNKNVSFTVTNYINDGSISLTAFDNAVSSKDNTCEHVSFEVVSYEKGKTDVNIEGLSGGSAILVATTIESDNKVASIRINVREYSDTLSIKNTQMYVSPEKDFKPSSNDYTFGSNTTERDLDFFYITNPDKIAGTELSYFKEDDVDKFNQEDVAEKLVVVKFDTCKIDQETKKIQLYLAENKVYEISVADAQIHKFVASYKNLSGTYSLNVISSFYGFLGIEKFTVDKDEISLIAYSTETDSQSTFTVEVPYVEGGEVSFGYEVADEERNIISTDLKKVTSGAKTVYTFTVKNKVAYKTTANIKLKLYYNNFDNILDDQSVSFTKDINVNILVKPKEIRVNNLLESSDDNSYVFYNNYKGDFGWQEFNIAIYASDSSYDGVEITYGDDIIVKQGDITIGSGNLVTNLEKPLLIRGVNDSAVASGRTIEVKVKSAVFTDSDKLTYTINYSIASGAKILTILDANDYSLENPENAVYVASNAGVVEYTGLSADNTFAYATATSMSDSNVIKVNFLRNESNKVILGLEPIKKGVETFIIRLDNGVSKEVVFRVEDTFNVVNITQKIDEENIGVYSFDTEEDSGILHLNAIIKNVASSEMGCTTIQVSSDNGIDVIESVTVEDFAGNVINVLEKNGYIFTFKAKNYGSETITLKVKGIQVSEEDFTLTNIEKIVQTKFTVYNPLSKLEVKIDGTLISKVDLYGVSSADSLKSKTFSINTVGLNGLVPYNFYSIIEDSYKEENFAQKFVYWTIASTNSSASYKIAEASGGAIATKMLYGETYYIKNGEKIVALFDTELMKISALTDDESSFVLYVNVQQYGITRSYAITISITPYEKVDSINLNITDLNLSFKSTDTEPIRFTATLSKLTATNLKIACILQDESGFIDSVEYEEIKKGTYVITIRKSGDPSGIIKDAKLWICADEWVENGVVISDNEKCKEITIKYENGSKDNPFILRSAADVVAIGTSSVTMSAYYTLKSDIDMSSYSDILPLSNLEFKGGITGYNGATIKGIKISNSKTIEGEICYGLFAKIGASAVIENVIFEGTINVEGAVTNSNIGLIAGINAGTLKNIAVKLGSSNITTSDLANIGGLVGTNSGKVIKEDLSSYEEDGVYYNCSPMITVYMNNALRITGKANVGGIAGINSGEIKNTGARTTNGYSGYMSYVNIALNDAGYAGSIAGINKNIIEGLETSNIYVGGIISSEKSDVYTYAYVGGIVGQQNNGEILNYITMRTLLRGYEVGAIYANIDGEKAATNISIEATDDGIRTGIESAMIVNYDGTSSSESQIAENRTSAIITYASANISYKSYLDREKVATDKTNLTIAQYYGDYICVNRSSNEVSNSVSFPSESSSALMVNVNTDAGFNSFDKVDEDGDDAFIVPMYYFNAAGYLNINRELTTVDLQAKAQDVLDKYLNTIKVDNKVLRPFNLSEGEYKITSDREFLTINSNNEFFVSGTGLVKLTISSILNARQNTIVYVYIMDYFDLASKLSYYKIGDVRLKIDADVKLFNEISIETVANYINKIEIEDEKYINIDEDGYVTSTLIGNTIKLKENSDVDSEIRIIGGEITIGSTKSTWKIEKITGSEYVVVNYAGTKITSTKMEKEGDIDVAYITIDGINYKLSYNGTQIFIWNIEANTNKITVYTSSSDKDFNWKVINDVLYVSEDKIYSGDSNKITIDSEVDDEVDEEYDYEYVGDELHVSKGISVDSSTLTIDETIYNWKVINDVLYVSENEIYSGDSNKITADSEYDYEYVSGGELHVSKGISIDGSILKIGATTYNWKIIDGKLYIADNIYTGSGIIYNWKIIDGKLYIANNFYTANANTVKIDGTEYNYKLINNGEDEIIMRKWLSTTTINIDNSAKTVELDGTTYKFSYTEGVLSLLDSSTDEVLVSSNSGEITAPDATIYFYEYTSSGLDMWTCWSTGRYDSSELSNGWLIEGVKASASNSSGTINLDDINYNYVIDGSDLYLMKAVKGSANITSASQISINGKGYNFSYADSILKLWQYQATGSSGIINLATNYSYVIDGSKLHLMKNVKGLANTSASQISINEINYNFSYVNPTLKLWQYQSTTGKIKISSSESAPEYDYVIDGSKLYLMTNVAHVGIASGEISINGVNYKFTYTDSKLSFSNEDNIDNKLYDYSNRIASVYYCVMDDASGSIIVSKKAGIIIPKGSYDIIELVSKLNTTVNDDPFKLILGSATNVTLNYLEGVTKITSNYDNYAINTSTMQTDFVAIYTDDTEGDVLLTSIVGKDVEYIEGNLFNVVKSKKDNLSTPNKKNVYEVSIGVNKGSDEYINRHTKNIYGTYIVRFYTNSNSNIYKEIELVLDDQYLDKIVYENYNVEWEDEGVIKSMTSTARVVPANYGLLSVAISPADCDFYRFNVTNNAINYITGSTATGFEIGYLNSSMKFIAISGIGYTTGGAYISKESLTNIPNYDGQFYIKYMFTNDSSVIDGSRVALDFKLTDKQGNAIAGSENTETYTVYKKYFFDLSIPGKVFNSITTSYLLARGLTYDLNIENNGYDEESIEIATDMPSLATIEKNIAGKYVVKLSEKSLIYSSGNSVFKIIATATRKNNLGKTETIKSVLQCNVMEYVVNYSGEEDIISGYNKGNLSVAMGDRISLRVDMKKYIEYNSSDTLICEKVQAFLDELTQNGVWEATYITGDSTTQSRVFTYNENSSDTTYFYMYTNLILAPNVEHNPENREYYLTFAGDYEISAANGIYTFKEGSNIKSEFNIKSYIRGSNDTPIPIQEYSQFKKMNEGGNYILLNDIYVTPSEYEPFEADFTTLDGNSYKIIFKDNKGEKNETVTFDVSNYDKIGLFSSISSEAIIKNLTIKMGENQEQIIFSTESDGAVQFGLLAASNNGIITNVQVEGSNVCFKFANKNPVAGSIFAGLVAQNSGYITNSRVKVGLQSAVSMAGLVGNNNGTIASSYFKDANIDNTSDQNTVFSTAGLCLVNNENGKILTSYVSGKVDAENIYCNKNDKSGYKITSKVQVAAFVYANAGSVKDCYSNVLLSTVAGSSGFTFYNGGTISNCFSTSIILDDYKQSNYYFASSDKYETDTGSFENCYYLTENTEYIKINVSLASKTIQGVQPLNISGFSFDKLADNFSSYAYGSAPSEYNNVWVYANTGSFSEDVFKEYIIDDKDGKNANVSVTANPQSFSMGRLELVSANIIALSYRILNKDDNKESTEDSTDYSYTYAFKAQYGTIHNPYLIDSVDTFETLFENINDGKKSIRFISDLDYSDYDKTLTAYNKTLKGVIEGNGMIIRNIEINANDTMSAAGLIGNIDGEGTKAGIFNLVLIPKLVNFPNSQVVGTLVGKVSDANIENIEVLSSIGDDNVQQESSVTISGKNIVGGVIGLATKKCTIKNITSSVGSKATYVPSIYEERADLIFTNIDNISDYSYAGGVIGYAYTNSSELIINDIKYYGTDPYIIGGRAGYIFGGLSNGVKSSLINVDMSDSMIMKAYSYAGIIAGESAGTIEDVRINGTGNYLRLFSVDTYIPEAVGGVVGYMIQGKLSNIYMGQSLEVKETTKTIENVGGIVGYVNNNDSGNTIQIEKIILDGDLHTHSTLGGIVGLSESIMTLDNIAIYKRTFTVDGNLETTYVGGFVGANNANVTITDSYSWADVVVESYVYSTAITAHVSSILANPSPYASVTLTNIYTTTMFTITLENKSATVVDDVNTNGEVKYVTESTSSSDFYATLSGTKKYPGLSYTLNRLKDVDKYQNVYTMLGSEADGYASVLGKTTIFRARTNAQSIASTGDSSLAVALTQNDFGKGIVEFDKVGEGEALPTEKMFYGCMRLEVTEPNAQFEWTKNSKNYKNIEDWINPLDQNREPNKLPYLNFEAGIRP